MYKYLFGPVPSRRLGMSLGIDLVPRKVCSLDCVYCEVGKTTKLTIERKEYHQYEKIVSEIEHYFINNPDPDYITFSGSGEPTLNSCFGKVVDFIKKIRPNIPVAVLTNGTLFFDKAVRNELLKADLVLQSLDAATDKVFKAINRPAEELKIEDCINGLIEFRKEFKGKIWLEIFILPGYNDTDDEIDKLKDAVLKINPDIVQLNSLDRPGTVAELITASADLLHNIVDKWGLPNVVIIAPNKKRKSVKSYRSDVENAIMETISRRPCTIDDLTKILGLHINEVNKYLGVLEADKKIVSFQQKRGVFYQAADKG